VNLIDGRVGDVNGFGVGKNGNDGADQEGDVSKLLPMHGSVGPAAATKRRVGPGYAAVRRSYFVVQLLEVQAWVLKTAFFLVALQDAGPLHLAEQAKNVGWVARATVIGEALERADVDAGGLDSGFCQMVQLGS